MVKSLNSSSSNNISDINVTSSTCSGKAAEKEIFNQHAEFEWEKQIQSTLLASFFYGYIVTQIPGGYLSDRFGGRRVFGTAMAIACVCTLLMPVCARVSVILVYVLRVLLGLATGVSFPAMQSMWGRWAPPLERSKLVTVSYLGTMFGNVGTFASSGYLCEYGFDNGWGSIFYITGGLACIWVVAWFVLVRDTPSDHPWISEAERDYINNSIEYDNTKRSSTVPWIEIAKSPAVIACITAHVCNNWINYTLLTSLPAFMKAVLKFNIKSNGVLSALPYVCQAVSGLGVGLFADLMRSKQLLSTTGTRRLWCSIAFLGSGAFLVATGFASCDQRNMAVAFLSLAVMFTGFNRAGYVVNHVDFGPKYAGVLFGITNTFATVPGMVAPIVAGALTPNDTQEEWRNVFYVCAAFCVVGMVVFGFFSSGEIQEWAKDRKEIIIEKPALDTDTKL
ncbi:SLC17A5 [Mytilus coruscus]|uniref:SLC17A5 n=1 Tax=Mytilus coruscus TaxID=42192 RepID=A0A6J7ZTN9_MYTCO|nr:SLC17A5 [Mytilus coruscus]